MIDRKTLRLLAVLLVGWRQGSRVPLRVTEASGGLCGDPSTFAERSRSNGHAYAQILGRNRRCPGSDPSPHSVRVIAVPPKGSVPAPGQEPDSCWRRARLVRVAGAA